MKREHFFLAVILALGFFVIPIPSVLAQSTPTSLTSSVQESQAVSAADDKDKEEKSWGLAADLTFDLGIGAFVENEYARRIRSKFGVLLSGYYTIPVIDTNIDLSTGFSLWMSKAGGTNGKNEFRWADSYIGFSRELYSYKGEDTKFMLNAALGFVLPTSKASWTTNLYTGIVPQLGIAFKLAQFGISYNVSYTHNFNKYTSASVNPNEVDALARAAGNELLSASNIAIDGVLTEMELVNSFTISYDILDNLTFALGLAFADYWTYDNKTITRDDDLVNPNAKVGRGHGQMSAGSISLAYSPWEYTTLTLFLKSEQPWKQLDNKEMRFPWFDFTSTAKNYTKFGLVASFHY